MTQSQPAGPADRQIAQLWQAVEEQTRLLKSVMAHAAQAYALAAAPPEADAPARAAAHAQLQNSQEALQAALYALHDRLEAARLAAAPNPPRGQAGANAPRRLAPSDYRQLIGRIREVVRARLPRHAPVLVVSRGDDELLDLYGRPAWHFPQADDGGYSGSYPAGSSGAIVHLETLRARGAGYLLFPWPALWWLDHYADFREHLERRYRLLVREADTCLIYALCEPPDSMRARVLAELDAILQQAPIDGDRVPALLDWDTGLSLADAFPHASVFSPPAPGAQLPYMDDSIDIVVLASADPLRQAEAQRVASLAVVNAPESAAAGAAVAADVDGSEVAVSWKLARLRSRPTRASLVVPADVLRAVAECGQAALQALLPAGDFAELVVVGGGAVPPAVSQLAAGRLKVVDYDATCSLADACNLGAAEASGERLVFVTAPLLALPGWLPALLRTFDDHPRAGVVGGKLVYASGVLAAAGEVIYADGGVAALGTGDYDAAAPLYHYVRPVDSCSAPCFATRRELFIGCGGLDETYACLQYAAADYACLARARGAEAYYQPEAAFVLLDTAPAAPAALEADRRRFAAKWHHVLRHQPLPPTEFTRAAWHALAVRGPSQGAERYDYQTSPYLSDARA